jgi:hypothetical protein
MQKEYQKKSKINNMWNNMLELIAIEEQIIIKLDNLEESIKILSQKVNNLEFK